MSNPPRPATGAVIDTAWGLNVADTVVRRYPNAATRNTDLSGFSGAALLGQSVVLTDTNRLQIHNGTSWITVMPAMAGVTAAVTDGRATFGDLTGSAGPAVSVETGTAALVTITAAIYPATALARGEITVDLSGATTLVGSNPLLSIQAPNAGGGGRQSASALLTGLTAGVNTFTTKYRTLGGGGTGWSDRLITVTGRP